MAQHPLHAGPPFLPPPPGDRLLFNQAARIDLGHGHIGLRLSTVTSQLHLISIIWDFDETIHQVLFPSLPQQGQLGPPSPTEDANYLNLLEEAAKPSFLIVPFQSPTRKALPSTTCADLLFNAAQEALPGEYIYGVEGRIFEIALAVQQGKYPSP